jgi:hypothetical protein
MNAKLFRIEHPHISFPNRLIVHLGIEPDGADIAESIRIVAMIEKPERELRDLTFAQIESLAVARARAFLSLALGK